MIRMMKALSFSDISVEVVMWKGRKESGGVSCMIHESALRVSSSANCAYVHGNGPKH